MTTVLERLASLDDLEEVATGRAWRSFHAQLRAHDALPRRVALVCRARIAQLLGTEVEPGPSWSPEDLERLTQLRSWMDAAVFDARDRAALAYAEQFIVDANGIDRDLAAPVAAHLGDTGLVVLTVWLGVVESEERLRRVLALAPGRWTADLDALGGVGAATPGHVDAGVHPWPDVHDPTPPSVQDLLAVHASDLAAARAAVGAASEGLVTARTNELLRLISANAVDCRFCRNVRYRGTGTDQLVAEEEIPALLTGASAAGSSGLTTGEMAATALGRAFFAGDGPLDAATAAALADAFEPQALLEAVVTILRNPAGSKAMVALGLIPDETPLVVL